METLNAKWMELSLYRRILLAVMLAEIIGFLIATVVAVNRPGLEYGDALLYPSTEGTLRIYEGKVDKEPARFTVSPEGEISYQWGDFSYGPWQVRVDPAAYPASLGTHDGKYHVGLEIHCGSEGLFRGGYCPGNTISLWDENGEPIFSGIAFSVTSGSQEIAVSADGRELSQRERYEPSFSALARIVLAPELAHRGSILLYLATTLLALFNVVQFCFPGLFFRLSLWGHVRNINDAEPSDFYIAMEKLEWGMLAVICLVLYSLPLNTIYA